jgi:hypothetical protein
MGLFRKFSQSPKYRASNPRIEMIRSKLLQVRKQTPHHARDVWYYEADEEMVSKLAKMRAQLEPSDRPASHKGCDTWLDPWDEECRIYDL